MGVPKRSIEDFVKFNLKMAELRSPVKRTKRTVSFVSALVKRLPSKKRRNAASR